MSLSIIILNIIICLIFFAFIIFFIKTFILQVYINRQYRKIKNLISNDIYFKYKHDNNIKCKIISIDSFNFYQNPLMFIEIYYNDSKNPFKLKTTLSDFYNLWVSIC